jgi:DNA gyrase subunit B
MQKFSSIFKAIARKGDSRILQMAILDGLISVETLKSESLLEQLGGQLQSYIGSKFQNGSSELVFKIAVDPEHSGFFKLVCDTKIGGARLRTEFSKDLMEHPDLIEAQRLQGFVKELGGRPFTLTNAKGEKEEFLDPEALVASVLEKGKEGFYIQRYKGLGEMNPEQLWETTMDPNKRTFLQVSVEDAAASDGIFSVLMGEDVEARREFIEKNALRVRNLDI